MQRFFRRFATLNSLATPKNRSRELVLGPSWCFRTNHVRTRLPRGTPVPNKRLSLRNEHVSWLTSGGSGCLVLRRSSTRSGPSCSVPRRTPDRCSSGCSQSGCRYAVRPQQRTRLGAGVLIYLDALENFNFLLSVALCVGSMRLPSGVDVMPFAEVTRHFPSLLWRTEVSRKIHSVCPFCSTFSAFIPCYPSLARKERVCVTVRRVKILSNLLLA